MTHYHQEILWLILKSGSAFNWHNYYHCRLWPKMIQNLIMEMVDTPILSPDPSSMKCPSWGVHIWNMSNLISTRCDNTAYCVTNTAFPDWPMQIMCSPAKVDHELKHHTILNSWLTFKGFTQRIVCGIRKTSSLTRHFNCVNGGGASLLMIYGLKHITSNLFSKNLVKVFAN